MLVRYRIIEVEGNSEFAGGTCGIDDWAAEDFVAEDVGLVGSNKICAKFSRSFIVFPIDRAR